MSRSAAERGSVPLWRWGVWWFLLVIADIVFYVLLTPVWLGIRAAARLAELRARAAPSQVSDPGLRRD